MQDPGSPPASLPAATSGQVVRGNRWDELEVPALGSWTPLHRVSVVLPHYEAPDALELTLTALARQTYPAELIQVVVADDGSSPPLQLPHRHRGLDLTVVHQQDLGFRLAAVRNLGAAEADGDILVFLDCDMVPEPHHLEAHARWHHACDHAVTLGFRHHVSFEGIGDQDVARAADAGELAPLFEGRPRSQPAWLERHMDRMHELTSDDDDLFRATTGGNLGVRAATFRAVGGFDASFTQWGSEDTDLGHRLFLAGALFVPDRRAACWHQGDSGGLEPHERTSLDQQRARLSQTIPHRGFRRAAPGRSFRVPSLLVEVAVTDEPHAAVTGTLESILASEVHDLEVLLRIPAGHPDRLRLDREWAGDARVVREQRPDHARTPYHATLPVGIALEPDAIGRMLARLRDPLRPAGVLTIDLAAAPAGTPEVVATSTRAFGRAHAIASPDPRAAAEELFGAASVRGEDIGCSWAPVERLQRLPATPAVERPAAAIRRPPATAPDRSERAIAVLRRVLPASLRAVLGRLRRRSLR